MGIWKLAALGAGALVVLLAACDSDSEAAAPTEIPTASPTASPTPFQTPTPECDAKCELLKTLTPVPTSAPILQAPGYPSGTRTGDPDVDAIFAAIESGDAAALASLIELSSEPCEAERPQQPQPLRCPDGASVGTPLVGFWWTHVEGGLLRVSADEVAARILETARERKWRLHSVYSFDLAGRADDWKPDTDFFITFAAFQPQVGGEFDNLRIVDGRIIALHYAFPEPYGVWDSPSDSGWLLPRAP